MLGMIGAMEREVDMLRGAMEQVSVLEHAGLRFYSGTLLGKDVVLCRCGPGKVNAALCAQCMIERFAPQEIINFGVAGGIGDEVEITDIVVARDVCQHDMDTTAVGDEIGFISGLGRVKIPCDEGILRRLLDAAVQVGARVHVGTVASGDQFISTRGQRERVKNLFQAAAVEMEGGSVGHVCFQNGVKFGVMRCISDSGDEAAQMEYPAFCEIAAKKSMEIIRAFLTLS